MPGYFYKDNKDKIWKLLVKEVILVTLQTYTYELFTNVSLGLRSCIPNCVEWNLNKFKKSKFM